MTEESNLSFSFVEAEKKILDFWKKENIFQKSLKKTEKNKPYIFYDGPPFATGLPHHGHLVANTLKDVIPRYFTMRGRYVDRRFGWDCHGLPIEHEIDKKLGMSAHDAVAKLGVRKYNEECRGIVSRYTQEWEKTISRLGRWVDFENDYKTMDLSFMESVWWVFKQCWDKGLIYQGNKVVPFSTALGTALSNFEANLNYQDTQDPAVTVLFKLQDEPGYVAAWTTTPWTLPSNLGLCVNAEVDYVKVKDLEKNMEFYIAEARVEAYSKKHKLEVVQKLKGSALKGKKYQPLFPFFKDLKSEGAFQIFNDDYVTTTDGTGVVHLAPAFGEDDNRVMKNAGVKTIVCPIDTAGKFTDEVPAFKGEYVKEADKNIIKALKDQGQLFEQATINHSYPFCYRSDTPLIYRAIPSWYLAVEKIKEDLLASNQETNWVPDHIKDGRFGKWLESARDWAISRNRVWGTPLPIWQNEESGKFICLGSVEELEKLSHTKVTDIHRENVDELVFEVKGEKGKYRRITDVLDCWFESGSMPYAQLHYPFENQKLFGEGFPAEFIAEGLDQTRGWFYTLTVLSTALYKKPAFKNVIVNGLVLAKDGKKMSKRLKNYTAPDELMENFGADALRLFYINSALVKGEEMRFNDEGVKEMVRKALLPWYNSFKFFQTYAEVDKWNPNKHYREGTNILDQWLISRQQTLISNVSKEMEAYHLYNVVPELFNFIEELTNWYIRLNRRRFWESDLSQDKCEAYSTLYSALKTLSQLMAPFAPFLSDYLYLELAKFGEIKEQSVHLCDYPMAQDKKKSPELEAAVERMQQIVLLGRQKRNQKQIKVKTPLSTLTIIHKDKKLLDEISKLEEFIKIELNVKDLEYSQEEDKFINLYCKPNSPVLGKRLGKNFAQFRQKIEALKPEQLTEVEKGKAVKIDNESFTKDDLLVFREAKAGSEALSNSLITIDLNCTLDQNLIDEGLAREVVNRIQKTRKDLEFNVADRIHVSYQASPKMSEVIEKFKSYISSETLSTKITSAIKLDDPKEFDIDEEIIKISLKKE
ncbi:MAG: isoleucine--tRNA ligase [Bacteriovoracaceae bacterium]|nr:isoleucine--tRNA ligase [Bacteriovoracaceae bacterium]